MASRAERPVKLVSSRSPRSAPHDLSAEESLLGAMILSRDAIAIALVACSAEDFYKPAHGHVFGAITSLYAQGEPADPVTVADELRRSGLLEAIGGSGTLISLQVATPAISSAGRYAAIVAELALLRRLIGAASEIAELGYSLPEDVANTIDQAEALVYAVAQRRRTDSLTEATELMQQVLDRIEARFERGEAITGLATGFRDLDERLAGLQPSNLIIIGARPSMGKTSLALGMAAHAAIRARVPTLVVSLEMSQAELGERLLAGEARVDLARLRNGQLRETDWSRIASAVGPLGSAPLVIDDDPASTVLDVRATARRLKSKDGLGLVVVDYLQLMVGGSAENRQVEVSEISRGLKLLARELEIPVVALAQLSRNLEMRADKRPTLADLRDSGALEQDADVVLMAYRDEIYHPESPDRGSAEIIVAKHRNGPTGAPIHLAFLDYCAHFADMARI